MWSHVWAKLGGKKYFLSRFWVKKWTSAGQAELNSCSVQTFTHCGLDKRLDNEGKSPTELWEYISSEMVQHIILDYD